MKGYRWYINCANGTFEPNEKTFEDIVDCIEDIKSSSYYRPDQDNYFIGVDYCEDDDGCIQVLHQICIPTEVFYNE